MLRAFVLALDDDARRQMRDPHRRIRLVHVLSPCPRRTVRIDPQVFFVDIDDDLIVDLGIDENRCERGMPARPGVKRGNPHQPVNAVFGLGVPVRIRPLQREGYALDPRFVTGKTVDHGGGEFAFLRPAEVHPQKHFRPVLGFRPPRARVNGDDGVQGVFLVAQHSLQFVLTNVIIQAVKFGVDFGKDGGVLFRLGQRVQIGEFVERTLLTMPALDGFVEGGFLFEDFAGFFRVVPEIGLLGRQLQFLAAEVQGGDVKDTLRCA